MQQNPRGQSRGRHRKRDLLERADSEEDPMAKTVDAASCANDKTDVPAVVIGDSEPDRSAPICTSATSAAMMMMPMSANSRRSSR